MKIERQRKNIFLVFFYFKTVLCNFLIWSKYCHTCPFDTRTCTIVNNVRRITAVKIWHHYPRKLYKARKMPSYRHRTHLALLSYAIKTPLHKKFPSAAGDKEVAVWIINSVWNIRKCSGVNSALRIPVLWLRSALGNLCAVYSLL